jgi:hypothetical protein
MKLTPLFLYFRKMPCYVSNLPVYLDQISRGIFPIDIDWIACTPEKPASASSAEQGQEPVITALRSSLQLDVREVVEEEYIFLTF